MATIEKKIQIPDTDTLVKDSPEIIKYLKDFGEVLFRYTTKLGDLLNKGVGIDNFAETWDDCRIPGLSARTNATAPDLEAFGPSGNLLAYAFNGAATAEQCYFSIQLPHGYKEGSDIHPHVHWAPTTAAAGNVKWQLEYSWANMDGTFGAPTTIFGIGAAGGTAWKHILTDLTDISGTGKTVSSMLMCRLFRNPADSSDTYEADATLLEFDIHFIVDSLGSKKELTKV
jgi:hypothetical protein